MGVDEGRGPLGGAGGNPGRKGNHTIVGPRPGETSGTLASVGMDEAGRREVRESDLSSLNVLPVCVCFIAYKDVPRHLWANTQSLLVQDITLEAFMTTVSTPTYEIHLAPPIVGTRGGCPNATSWIPTVLALPAPLARVRAVASFPARTVAACYKVHVDGGVSRYETDTADEILRGRKGALGPRAEPHPFRCSQDTELTATDAERAQWRERCEFVEVCPLSSRGPPCTALVCVRPRTLSLHHLPPVETSGPYRTRAAQEGLQPLLERNIMSVSGARPPTPSLPPPPPGVAHLTHYVLNTYAPCSFPLRSRSASRRRSARAFSSRAHQGMR